MVHQVALLVIHTYTYVVCPAYHSFFAIYLVTQTLVLVWWRRVYLMFFCVLPYLFTFVLSLVRSDMIGVVRGRGGGRQTRHHKLIVHGVIFWHFGFMRVSCLRR